MYRRPWTILAVLGLIMLGGSEFAWAVKQIAPRVDASSSSLRPLAVYYSYPLANRQHMAFGHRIRVFLMVREQAILESDQDLVAEVKITDVSDSDTTRVLYVPVSLNRQGKGEYKLATLEVNNDHVAEGAEPLIQPARVYRLFINLHRQSEQYGTETVWGRVMDPYYVATAGEDNMELARQQIVMRTFKEFYYRKRGWRSGERYPMDCYAYYMWATGFCTVGAENGRTRLHNLFGGRFPFHRGSHIAHLSRRGPIHADYVRKPGHSFMLLAYDPQQKHVWCMEGNFNSTIEVVIRSVDSGWTVGHLVDDHIREELFN